MELEKIKKQGKLTSIVVGFVAFIVIAMITNLFFSNDLPIQIVGALLEAVITAMITYSLLSGQTEQEEIKERQVKVFEHKIPIYTEFTKKIWRLVYAFDEEDNTNVAKKYEELKLYCFEELIFFLKQDETKKLTEVIGQIDTTKLLEANLPHICQITNILQNSLELGSKHEDASHLEKLYDAFDKKDIGKIDDTKEKGISISDGQQSSAQNITFWHFNMLDEKQQIQAFEDGNWVLALIEYGDEKWRTNLIRQVKPNDVIFLFKRGGTGYIGAFRALDPPSKILEKKDESKYSKDDFKKYDIYEGINDGAIWASNILVEPIAYNFKGVGYYTVRRRTIERMNDKEAIKFLLNRFNGKDLDDNRLDGKGKFDDGKNVPLKDNYFKEIISKPNLQ